MENKLQPLQELIDQAIEILGEIQVHPDHQQLLDDGYEPDFTISNAMRALNELDNAI